MPSSPTQRPLVALAVALLLAAGCGGGADDVAVDAAATSSPTSTATATGAPSPSPSPTPTSTPTGTPTEATSAAPASPGPTSDDGGAGTPAPTQAPADPEEACGEEDIGITLVAPEDGAAITDGDVIAGCGSTFEATYRWEVVYDDGGTDEGFGTMTCGNGCIGTFEQELELTGSGPATLRLFEDDPGDGGRTSVVERSVTVG